VRRCILCGKLAENAHWPIAIGMGCRRDSERAKSLPQLPLCHPCHMAAHHAHRPTVLRLIELAPAYWRIVGEWETNQEIFEVWLDKWKTRIGG
jgi:hypothetical protein